MAYIMEWPSFWTSLMMRCFTLVSETTGVAEQFLFLFNCGGLVVFMDVYLQPHLEANQLEGRTMIVTGGNSGTGRQTAMELVQYGATVYLGCRSSSKCREASKEMNNAASRSGGKVALFAFKP